MTKLTKHSHVNTSFINNENILKSIKILYHPQDDLLCWCWDHANVDYSLDDNFLAEYPGIKTLFMDTIELKLKVKRPDSFQIYLVSGDG